MIARLDRLVALLACPDCKSPLDRPSDSGLRCSRCGTDYPISDGIPQLLKTTSATWSPKLVYRDPVAPDSLKGRLRSITWLRDLVRGYRNLARFFHLPSDWAPGPHIARMVRTHLDHRPDQVALDIGGGSGYYRDGFARKGCELFTLDIQREPGVDVIGTAFSLPLPDASVEVTCMFQVLEHLYDPQTALRECARVLKPGGHLLLTVPQFSHIHGWPSDYFRYTNHGIRHLAELAGLEVIEEKPMGGRFSVVACAIGNCFNMGAGPLRYALFSPLSYAACLLDRAFERANLASANPDTVGWAVAMRKRS